MKIKLRPGRDGIWLGVNCVAALIFLTLSTGLWVEPELKGYPVATEGTFFVFSLLVLETLGPLTALNVAWLAVTLWKSHHERDWTPVYVFGGMAVAWLALVAFNASKVAN